jgi:hypothetical protein
MQKKPYYTIKYNYKEFTSNQENIRKTVEDIAKEYNCEVDKLIFAGMNLANEEGYEKLSSESRHKGVILHLLTYPILKTTEEIFSCLLNETGGWKELGKNKPVATFNSGSWTWFYKNYDKLNDKNKEELLLMMSEYVSKKQGHEIDVKISETFVSIEQLLQNKSKQFYFYIPYFFNVACCVSDIDESEAINTISDFHSEKSENKKTLINIVFGDYYKDYLTEELSKNKTFMEKFNEYNEL